ncbi:MAG: DUF483 domain-containing protein [Patescibacteria group bacterium]|nr:DUF483 domain-containing protein [Patescibacteria group bacterium]
MLILKGYIDLMMIYDTIPQYFNPRYQPFNRSLPDVLAVLGGVKPLTRLNLDAGDSYSPFLKVIRRNKLHTAVAEDRTGYAMHAGVRYIYVARKRKIADFYKLNDPENSARLPSETDEKKFASDLGYPKCCIGNYFKKTQKGIVKAFLRQSEIKQAPFYLNNLFHSISNDFLSFHAPCSLDCKKTELYNKKIYKAIEKIEPSFAARLKKILSMPLAVWFNKLFDDRVLILFDGLAEKNVIKYSKCFILRAAYPRNRPVGIKIEKSFLYFRLGNKIRQKGNKVFIYRDDTVLHTFTNSDQQGIALLKFYA